MRITIPILDSVPHVLAGCAAGFVNLVGVTVFLGSKRRDVQLVGLAAAATSIVVACRTKNLDIQVAQLHMPVIVGAMDVAYNLLKDQPSLISMAVPAVVASTASFLALGALGALGGIVIKIPRE